MDQLIPGLGSLVAAFRPCFRIEVFQTFQVAIAGWIVCLGPHTISQVWQATGLAARRHHDLIYSLFRSARWDWDELGLISATLILAHMVPGGEVWVAVDDTLCHKRGAKVAFGGIHLDPVLSTRKHKTFRFGLNWVVLGLAVPMPLRSDRYVCLPVLWRLCRKKGRKGYRPRPQLAAELAARLAGAFPERRFWLVGDSAYVNASLLRHRPENLEMIGPLGWRAALYERPGPYRGRGRRPKKGPRLPRPVEMIEDEARFPAERIEVDFPGRRRELRVQVIRDILWYTGCGDAPVAVVLVRDPAGKWRDEALVVTDPGADAKAVIEGYCRRWSIELAFFDSKQFLGLHDPRVRCERSVERAHPMAWFVGTLVVLWYSIEGHSGPQVHRERPWYKRKPVPTFTDMLGALRLQMWNEAVFEGCADETVPKKKVERLLHTLAAVG